MSELSDRLRDYSHKSAVMAHYHTRNGLRDDADYWSAHAADMLAAADLLDSRAPVQASEARGDVGDEVHRVRDFESGAVSCLRCGSKFNLWFNGGELDSHECCGLVYAQEYGSGPDLVVRNVQSAHTQAGPVG